MNTQHTPGPWDYITGKTLHHVETHMDHPVGAGIPICSIPKSREANARLISAAPDLLEAVQALLQSFSVRATCDGETPFGQSTATLSDGTKVDRFKYAREAIAKAKGEPC